MIVEVGCLKYISNNDDRNGCPSDISLPTSQNIPHKAVQTRIDYLLELWCNNTCDTAFTNSTQPWFECYQTEMVWIRNACTQSNSTPCNLTPSFLSRICTHAHPHTPQTHTHTHTQTFQSTVICPHSNSKEAESFPVFAAQRLPLSGKGLKLFVSIVLQWNRGLYGSGERPQDVNYLPQSQMKPFSLVFGFLYSVLSTWPSATVYSKYLWKQSTT